MPIRSMTLRSKLCGFLELRFAASSDAIQCSTCEAKKEDGGCDWYDGYPRSEYCWSD